MILGLQVIALLFSLIMLYFVYLHYRRKELNNMEFVLWGIIWLGAISIIIYPQFFGRFAKSIAISRAFDLAVIAGFIVIIPIVYTSHIEVKRLKRRIEDFIRNESLQVDLEKKKRKKKNA